jgi:hypothetical protein
LTPNFNTVELVNFLEIKQEVHI